MAKWSCRATCFVKVFRLWFFSLKQFYDISIAQKLFFNAAHASNEMLSFLYRWDYCWKYEFDTDVNMHDGEQLGLKKGHIKTHRLCK